jgi:hypothetical protein
VPFPLISPRQVPYEYRSGSLGREDPNSSVLPPEAYCKVGELFAMSLYYTEHLACLVGDARDD